MTTMPDAQECKRQALLLIQQLEGRAMDAREAQISLIGAQIWATLATVPEPLEAIEHTAVLGSTEPFSRAQLIEEAFRHLPEVRCPHGYMAKVSLIREPGKDPQISFTWYLECPQGCP